MKSLQWMGGVLVGSLLTLVLVFGFGLLRPQPADAKPPAVKPATVKWEYMEIPANPVFADVGKMNEAGRNGWEAFAIDSARNVYLKRRK